MIKQTLVYPQNGTLLSNKKKNEPLIHTTTVRELKHYAVLFLKMTELWRTMVSVGMHRVQIQGDSQGSFFMEME